MLMCGICGFNSENKELIRRMCGVLVHRGPNSEGIYLDNDISLGNRRLSIIDVSERGRMPMSNKEGNLIITYNGEIYNFKEIKAVLEKKGYTFNSETDTEVILYAYQEFGSKCVNLFNGIFAFAIWDNRKKNLFLVRDHVGVKPLYYYYKNGVFGFASEIKAILLHPEVTRDIDVRTLNEIIYHAYPLSGNTLFKGIKELKPGHMLMLSGNKVRIEQYWDPKVLELDKPLDFFSKKLKRLIEDSVGMQLVSDVPLGVFLSGGIDSSLIAAVASKALSHPLKTVTLGFDEEGDEYKYAKIVANHCGTDHSEIHITSEDMLKALPNIVWHYEFPFTRPAIMAYYFLSNRTKGQLTVSQLGQGSDELFAGYNRYDAYTKLPDDLGNPDFKQLYNSLKLRINMSFDEKIRNLSSGVFKKDASVFFTDKALRYKFENNEYSSFIRGLKNDGSQLNPTLLYEIKTELPYYQLKMVDKTSMANSHEMRVPLLDYRIVELSLKIPSHFKFYGREKKIILKHIAKEYLPKEIVERKKLPMVVPLAKFKKMFIKSSADFLSESVLRDTGILKAKNVARHIGKLKSGALKDDNAYRQLLLFSTLALWKDLFISREKLG